MSLRTPALLAAILVSGAGCHRTDLNYATRTVTRDYDKPVAEAWDAAVTAAKDLDLKVESARHDALGGEIVARRADDALVNIGVAGVERGRTRIRIYIAPGNVELARLAHEEIAAAMGLGEAAGGWFGGNLLEAAYPQDLAACAAAARRASRALDFLITQDDAGETWARIDARLQNSVPVRFRLERAGDAETQATFTAGNSATAENEAIVRRMKDEFERQLEPAARSAEPAPASAEPAP